MYCRVVSPFSDIRCFWCVIFVNYHKLQFCALIKNKLVWPILLVTLLLPVSTVFFNDFGRYFHILTRQGPGAHRTLYITWNPGQKPLVGKYGPMLNSWLKAYCHSWDWTWSDVHGNVDIKIVDREQIGRRTTVFRARDICRTVTICLVGGSHRLRWALGSCSRWLLIT